MKQLKIGLLVIVALFLVGGVAFLMTWDIPPPAEPVARTIDDGRFPR